MIKTIKIDPRMFINKPFTKCPKCGKENFGVLHVYPHQYVKRCADCKYDERFPLPPLKRKVIYLDQFVISEMMKSINTELGKSQKVNSFYLELFKKLDRLNKLQLIVCPDSPIQDEESRVSSQYKSLKRMFEQLSHGTSFYHPEIVKRFQIHNLFSKWIGKDAQPLNIEDILHDSKGLSGWDSRLIISVSSTVSEQDLEDIRKGKKESSISMNEVVDKWIQDKKTYKEIYMQEINAFGSSIWRKYCDDLLNYEKGMNSPNDLNSLILSSVFSETSVLMTTIHTDLRALGYPDDEVIKKSFEFFNSDDIKDTLYAKIACAMYASLGYEYSNNRRQYPSAGFFNDVNAIASYAPYCDAMFIDNECRRLLMYKDAKAIYDLSSSVFSLDIKDAFLSYLDEIESKASKEHIELIHKVYGNDWPEPYIGMYDN